MAGKVGCKLELWPKQTSNYLDLSEGLTGYHQFVFCSGNC